MAQGRITSHVRKIQWRFHPFEPARSARLYLVTAIGTGAPEVQNDDISGARQIHPQRKRHGPAGFMRTVSHQLLVGQAGRGVRIRGRAMDGYRTRSLRTSSSKHIRRLNRPTQSGDRAARGLRNGREGCTRRGVRSAVASGLALLARTLQYTWRPKRKHVRRGLLDRRV